MTEAKRMINDITSRCGLTGPAVSLVEELLKEHLGLIPSILAASLLRKGPSAIFEILEATGLSFWQIRNSLLTLIQHNVVKFTLPSNATEPVRYYVYSDEALLRQRYPSYVLWVSKNKGRMSRLLFTHVLKTGRTSLRGAVQGVLNEIETVGDAFEVLEKQQKGEDEEEQDDEDIVIQGRKELSESALKTEFVKLVADNLLMRVDKPQSTSPSLSPTASGSVTSQPLQESSNAKPKAKPRVKSRAAKSSAKKQAAPDGLDPALIGLSKGISTGFGGEKELTKRRKLDHENDRTKQLKALMNEIEASNTIFTVNSQHLNLMLLREMAEDFMATRWAESRIVRLITRALLSTSRIQSKRVISRGATFEELTEDLRLYAKESEKSDLVFKVPEKNVLLKLLDTLGRNDKIIKNVTRDGSAVFLFDWDRLKEIMQRRLIYNAISARHGNKTGRVWSLLVESNKLSDSDSSVIELANGKLWDDQQVADQALLPPNAAREALYSLARDEFLRLHQSDVVSGGPSTLSSKHALVYAANEQLGKTNLLRKIYIMTLNILERKQSEAKEIATLVFRVTGLSETEGLELRQREAGEDRLEYAFLHLDSSLLISCHQRSLHGYVLHILTIVSERFFDYCDPGFLLGDLYYPQWHRDIMWSLLTRNRDRTDGMNSATSSSAVSAHVAPSFSSGTDASSTDVSRPTAGKKDFAQRRLAKEFLELSSNAAPNIRLLTTTASNPVSLTSQSSSSGVLGSTLLRGTGSPPSFAVEWLVEISGAQNTLYEGESFTLRFRFPEKYPMDSPEVIFTGTPPIHPHVYSNGWSPALGVMSICLSLVSMLSSCEKKEKPTDDHHYITLCGPRVSPKSMHWVFHDDTI